MDTKYLLHKTVYFKAHERKHTIVVFKSRPPHSNNPLGVLHLKHVRISTKNTVFD